MLVDAADMVICSALSSNSHLTAVCHPTPANLSPIPSPTWAGSIPSLPSCCALRRSADRPFLLQDALQPIRSLFRRIYKVAAGMAERLAKSVNLLCHPQHQALHHDDAILQPTYAFFRSCHPPFAFVAVRTLCPATFTANGCSPS
eukprot:scaffold323975_cov58-Attheya_sp.AAC.2